MKNAIKCIGFAAIAAIVCSVMTLAGCDDGETGEAGQTITAADYDIYGLEQVEGGVTAVHIEKNRKNGNPLIIVDL